MSLLRADQDLTRDSYYVATAPRGPGLSVLQEDLDADIAIVGGGLAGLSAAIELADRGFSVVLLEAREIGSGASGRNGGQAIHGLACDQGEIESHLGLEASKRVWAMSIEALDLIRARCARFAIDCDWQDIDLAGKHCREVTDYYLKELHLDRVQVDEIWSFIKPT